MRKIDKGNPPTNVRDPNRQPEGWLVVQRQYQAAQPWTAQSSPTAGQLRRNYFDVLHKPPVRAALAKEQKNLCAFCEGKIDASRQSGNLSIRVAHWIPVASRPERLLDWTNVFASCSDPKQCDSKQGDLNPGFPSPATRDYSPFIDFDHRGSADVRENAGLDSQSELALRRAFNGDGTGSLGLNNDELKRRRGEALKVWKEKLKKEKLASLRSHRGRLLDTSEPPEYISCILHWLDKRIARLSSGSPGQGATNS